MPLIWRFQKKFAGSGAHGDLNAHIIDMARFITGDEITEVVGSLAETFIKERDIVERGPKGGIAGGHQRRRGKKGKSDVDDAVLFLARFKRRRRRQLRSDPLRHRQPEQERPRDQRREGLRSASTSRT